MPKAIHVPSFSISWHQLLRRTLVRHSLEQRHASAVEAICESSLVRSAHSATVKELIKTL